MHRVGSENLSVDQLVPERHRRSNQNVLSVMIEVNRKLYLDESSTLKSGDFEEIQKVVSALKENLKRPLDYWAPC